MNINFQYIIIFTGLIAHTTFLDVAYASTLWAEFTGVGPGGNVEGAVIKEIPARKKAQCAIGYVYMFF